MKKLLHKLFGLHGIRFEGDTPSLWSLYKQNISIAWPATLEGALISIIGSIDTIMVGTLGAAAIAAVGLTGQPRMILLILAQALCVGTTALVARRKGADDREAANRAFAQSFGIVTVLGILISILGYVGAPFLMNLAGANEDTMALSTTYFRIISMGFIFNCWTLCICAALRAIGQTRITMVTNITANLVNVALNYILINGKLGFRPMGVAGAAIATAVGTFVSCVIALFFACRKGGYLRLDFKKAFAFDKPTVKALAGVGSSSMAESACMRVGFLITSKLIAGLGTAAFASYQIVTQVTGLSFTLGDGLAAAGATLVGQSLGAKRRDLAQAHVKISRKLSIVVSVALMVVIGVLRKPIAGLFTTEAHIIEGVILAFIVVMIGFIPQNGRVVYSGCLRGAGDTKYVAFCALISVTIVRPIATYLFCYPLNDLLPALRLDVTGPWLGFLVDACVRNPMLSHRIKTGKWMEIKL